MTDLKTYLEKEGYTNLKEVNFNGTKVLCGIYRFLFTTGLIYGIDEHSFEGRWCFNNRYEAVKVLENMTEIPEDLIIEGEWIKHKGKIEIPNPNVTVQ